MSDTTGLLLLLLLLLVGLMRPLIGQQVLRFKFKYLGYVCLLSTKGRLSTAKFKFKFKLSKAVLTAGFTTKFGASVLYCGLSSEMNITL